MIRDFEIHFQEERVLRKYLGNILIKTVLLTIYYMIKFFWEGWDCPWSCLFRINCTTFVESPGIYILWKAKYSTERGMVVSSGRWALVSRRCSRDSRTACFCQRKIFIIKYGRDRTSDFTENDFFCGNLVSLLNRRIW